MSVKLGVKNMRALARIALLGATAGLLAGCSSEVTRFGDGASADMTPTGATSLTPSATVGHNIASAPTRPPMANAPIQSSALAPPKAAFAAPSTPNPRLAAAPVRTAPTTGAIAAKGPAGGNWSVIGGTPVVVATGESLTTLSNRYGVPNDVLLKANGLTASQVQPGTRLVIPVYNGGVAAAPAQTERIAAAKPAAKEPVRLAAATPAKKPEAPKAAEKADKKTPAAKVALGKPDPKAAPKKDVKVADAKPVKPADKPKTAAAPEKPAKPIKMAKVEQAPLADNSRRPAVDPTPTATVRPTETPAKEDSDSANPEFRWPARGRVIQGFKAGGNDGINIALPEGTSVKAAESGVVAYAGSELKGYGNLVLIRHPNGFVSAYANNGDLDVKRGDTVKRGQTIAKSGQSGNVSSPQLHFELRKGSTPVDPTNYLAGL
jgi:murein DD-endopeptidase MepM/ murein hydrolase activator NlpD